MRGQEQIARACGSAGIKWHSWHSSLPGDPAEIYLLQNTEGGEAARGSARPGGALPAALREPAVQRNLLVDECLHQDGTPQAH